MADVKISELPALTSPDGAEELVVNDGGTTKKITIANATSASLAKAGGTMTGDTLHGDNVKAKFGTGNDLEIYHDGSNSYVRDIGTGNLLITTDGGEIRMLTNNVNEFGLRIVQDDYVGLYHNNAAKLHTTSTGIDVTGNVDLPDNGKLLLGAGDDLQIYHDGTNSHIADNGTGNLILNGNEVRILSDDTSEYSGRFITNGAVELYYDSAKKLSTTATGIDVTGTVTADGLGVSGNSSPNVSVTSTGGSVTLWSGADDAAGYVGTQSNHPLVLRTNQTERMRIDTSGFVGIGVVPRAWDSVTRDVLQIGGLGALTATPAASAGGEVGLQNNAYIATSGLEKYMITDEASAYLQSSGKHFFRVAPSGSAGSNVSWTNAMTIDNNGNTRWGAVTGTGNGVDINPGTNYTLRCSKAGVSETDQILFYNANGNVGQIRTSGSSTSYNTSSDYRLKTDVQPMTGATATFMQLKPCNFEWIADGTRVDGFLAHELGEVIPAAATGTHNGMMDEEYQATPATGDIYTAGTEAGYNEVSPEVVGGPAYYDINGVQIRAEIIAEPAVHEAFDAVAEVIHSSDVEQPETLEDGQQWRETTAQVMATRSVPDMQGIDQAKVVPLLVATLQEALARIEALEA